MKVKNKTLVALPLIGLCFSTLLFSCSRDDEKPIDEGTKVVFSVTVSSTHLYVGETAQIEIELTGLNSNKCNFTVNEAGKRIVSVDENGLVTAIGVGQAKITVTAADNLNYKKDLYFDVYQGMGERDEDLGIMVDEISSKDFENGVRFHGTVSMNLGTLVGGTVNIEPVIPKTPNPGMNISTMQKIRPIINKIAGTRFISVNSETTSSQNISFSFGCIISNCKTNYNMFSTNFFKIFQLFYKITQNNFKILYEGV